MDSLYTALLGRPADPPGEAFFVTSLGAGMTVEQAKALILGSPEYYRRAGGTDLLFLQSVYHDVLARPIDAPGSAAWTAALTHLDRATVSALILTSPEAQQDLVQADYQQYLHRPADPAGMSFWLSQVQQGKRDETLAASFLGSDEFFGGM